MKLNTLFNNPGSKKDRKRVGRGIGSGKGKTCGRGTKGQKSRSGVAIKGFEGGQMPLIKRLPKRGFNCPNSKVYQVVNLNDLERLVTEANININETITKEHLVKLGLIKNQSSLVKLLAKGSNEINKKLLIQFDACSQSAKALIEKAGGQVL
jgi:large subunit ribosomal protein L15